MAAANSCLSGRVAIVTGASRGIGKGIALELGRAGATVYVTGRSSRAGGVTTERALGSHGGEGEEVDATVDATAEAIDAMPGPGAGVAVVCDAGDDEAVTALVERVQREAGRLDCLVCSAFTTPPQLNGASFRDEFWKQGSPMWDACNSVGLRGVYVAACAAAPLMIETAKQHGGGGGGGGGHSNDSTSNKRPLMVLISSFGGKSYTFNVAYGVGKAGVDRLAGDMACQLSAPHGVDTVALYPGIVRTEGNLEMERRGEWKAASGGMDLNLGGAFVCGTLFSFRPFPLSLSDTHSPNMNKGNERVSERRHSRLDGIYLDSHHHPLFPFFGLLVA